MGGFGPVMSTPYTYTKKKLGEPEDPDRFKVQQDYEHWTATPPTQKTPGEQGGL
jgi:hypothetical protein